MTITTVSTTVLYCEKTPQNAPYNAISRQKVQKFSGEGAPRLRLKDDLRFRLLLGPGPQ